MPRWVEFLIALCALVVLSPLLIATAIIVYISLGRPLLFCQQRPGINGKAFYLYKFRTMQLGDAPDLQRLNAVGKIIRKLSLDELPQLFNVLRGDLSLVGPRPLLMEYLPLYSHEQARRHLVKPGITGWAQVNGRNAITWEEKFKLDVWYVEHKSFVLDCKILFMTVFKVLGARNIGTKDQLIMPRFTGNNVGQ